MPLRPGMPVSDAIHELTHHGSRPRNHNQIVAIALHNHDKKMADGGGLGDCEPMAAPIGNFAAGGVMNSLSYKPPHGLAKVTTPTAEGGFIHSAIPGRTDRLAMNVRHGSHIIPADVVGALGQGNSLAGAKHLDMIIRSLPSGYARGGRTKPLPKTSESILAAGGEYIISPEEVRAYGSGDIDEGHKRLDKMIVELRKKEAHRMLKLPGPKK